MHQLQRRLMNTLTTEESDELMAREDMCIFPSLYAASAYEMELNTSAYDQLVQAFYNL